LAGLFARRFFSESQEGVRGSNKAAASVGGLERARRRVFCAPFCSSRPTFALNPRLSRQFRFNLARAHGKRPCAEEADLTKWSASLSYHRDLARIAILIQDGEGLGQSFF
jgi:hypothetical protein